MSDDDLSEPILRASAFLDGELDAVETARAEASPAVMAEVERLRTLQAAIRDVDAPSSDARERAIAAALSEFDAVRIATSGVQSSSVARHLPAPVAVFRPRPAYARWLAIAAGFVGVGLLGVVIANGVGGDSDDSTAGQFADEATADLRAQSDSPRPEASIQSRTAAGSDSATSESVEAAAEIAAATEAPAADTALAGESTAAEDATIAMSAPAAAATTETELGTTTTTIVFDPDVALLDVDQLRSAGFQLAALNRAGTLTTPQTSCALGSFEALAIGRYVDGVERSVLIAVDPTTDQVAAFAVDTCEGVAFTPLP